MGPAKQFEPLAAPMYDKSDSDDKDLDADDVGLAKINGKNRKIVLES